MLIVNHDEAFTLGNSAVQSEGESSLVNYYPELSGANSIGTSIVKGLNVQTIQNYKLHWSKSITGR